MHQVMAIGNKELIELMLHGFKGDPNMKTHKGLSVMHCAAQHYSGYLSMLILVK